MLRGASSNIIGTARRQACNHAHRQAVTHICQKQESAWSPEIRFFVADYRRPRAFVHFLFRYLFANDDTVSLKVSDDACIEYLDPTAQATPAAYPVHEIRAGSPCNRSGHQAARELATRVIAEEFKHRDAMVSPSRDLPVRPGVTSLASLANWLPDGISRRQDRVAEGAGLSFGHCDFK